MSILSSCQISLPRWTGTQILTWILVLKKAMDGWFYDFRYLICQKINSRVSGNVLMVIVAIKAIAQFPPYFWKAQTFFFQSFDLTNNEEVLGCVAPLPSVRSQRDYDALQFLFPKAQGVFRQPQPLANCLNSQRLPRIFHGSQNETFAKRPLSPNLCVRLKF